MFLRQSTSQTIRFGPFLDSTDGVTAETGLTIAQADRQLSKDGGAFAQSNHTGNSTHDADGWYSDDLDATDTNTVGILKLQVVVSGALPVWETFYVLEEQVYDRLFAASAAGPLAASEVNAEVDTALTDIHLDHLLAADYDPATPPGVATALLNEIIESDGGVSRFTTNALEQAWQAATRVLTANTNLNDISTADVDARLAAIGLDHLLSAAVVGTDVTDDSVIAQLVSSAATADWDTYDNTTDALQAIRDRGDAAWTTGGGSGLTPLASGTAQGGTASTIQLAAGEAFADDELNGNVVKLTGGTGVGQSRVITDYTGSTDTATVSPNWTTNPDATTTYEVVEGSVNVTTWLQSAVNALVSGAVDADVSAVQAAAITAAAIATGAVDADALATDAVNEIRDAILSDSTAFAGANIDAAITSRLAPTTAGRTLDVAATGEAGIDFGNTTGTLDAAQIGSSAITADKIAAAAITAAKFGAGAIDANALATDAVNEIREAILPKQNEALSNIYFLFVDSTDHVTPVTGATGISAEVSKDGAAFAAAGGTVAEVGNGIYQFDATAADMNAGMVALRFSATGGTPNAPDDAFVYIPTTGSV